ASYAAYKPNPNWWDKEKIINGKKYDTPFVDELIFPIILDKSTQIAAIRTAKVDLAHTVDLKHKDTLASTCPDLKLEKYLAGSVYLVVFRSTSGPLVDKDLRRALMIGTDLETIVRINLTEGDVHCLPWNAGLSPVVYTPIEDLPPSTKELFTYDPAKAKQMITDAGYPDGLTLKLDYSATRFGAAELASLLEDMWSKIGVTAILQPHEHAIKQAMGTEGTYENALISHSGVVSRVSRLTSFMVMPWTLYHDDEYYIDLVSEAGAEMDEAKRNAMIKELGIYVVDNVSHMPLGNPYLLCCTWPWVKNYYREIDCAYVNYSAITPLIWIDQALKAELGY
ncbi:unnamed protein product, partial [marine sediment metagenome]